MQEMQLNWHVMVSSGTRVRNKCCVRRSQQQITRFLKLYYRFTTHSHPRSEPHHQLEYPAKAGEIHPIVAHIRVSLKTYRDP